MIQVNVLSGLFTNYEVTKLHIDNPYLLNNLIYATLLLVALATLKKKKSTFLDFSQTEQLRGLAILFVIIEHFWYHVCNEKNTVFLFGGYAVTLFLLLSGYGLMRSNMAHQIATREFLRKRVKKIFVPYWLVTVGIVIADYVLLHKKHPIHELIFTFSGINISTSLQYFEHARWFVTLLLIYYFAFFFCAKLWRPSYATLALLFFSLILILFRHYELFPLGARHQLLAFPLGCLLAVVSPIKWWDKKDIRYQITIVILIALAMLSIYLGGLKHTDTYYMGIALVYLQSYVLPYLFCLLSILSISFLANFGYTSKFLALFGCLSYELYLIHGPLLIKYNPIVGNFENGSTLIELLLWFEVVLGLACSLKACTAICNMRIQSPTA